MELWKLVHLVSKQYGKRLEQHSRDSKSSTGLEGVTVQQFQYLQAIHAHPAPTVGSLSRHFGVRSPTATVIIRRLEERGFLVRKVVNMDQRSKHLSLTRTALKLLNGQEAAFKALGEDIRRALTRQELADYIKLTQKVCDQLAHMSQSSKNMEQ